MNTSYEPPNISTEDPSDYAEDYFKNLKLSAE